MTDETNTTPTLDLGNFTPVHPAAIPSAPTVVIPQPAAVVVNTNPVVALDNVSIANTYTITPAQIHRFEFANGNVFETVIPDSSANTVKTTQATIHQFGNTFVTATVSNPAQNTYVPSPASLAAISKALQPPQIQPTAVADTNPSLMSTIESFAAKYGVVTFLGVAAVIVVGLFHFHVL